MSEDRAPCKDDAGTVTAETAVVLPVLVVLTVAFAWLVLLGVTHMRAVDAARETARLVARGESVAAASARGAAVAAPGSSIQVSVGAVEVSVSVTSPLRPPGRLLNVALGQEIEAHAVAAREPLS
ncbi:MAG TPA: TadE family type IV pilus minor pilin [Marmoricola sp.]|nr:TadE family type IV pilus minor pilin [Marmoricola sp.]